MRFCCVPFCLSKYDKNNKGLSFHEFPSDKGMQIKWVQRIFKDEDKLLVNQYTNVCSLHFTEDSYIHTKARRRLKRDSVPELFLDYRSLKAPTEDIVSAKHKRPVYKNFLMQSAPESLQSSVDKTLPPGKVSSSEDSKKQNILNDKVKTSKAGNKDTSAYHLRTRNKKRRNSPESVKPSVDIPMPSEKVSSSRNSQKQELSNGQVNLPKARKKYTIQTVQFIVPNPPICEQNPKKELEAVYNYVHEAFKYD